MEKDFEFWEDHLKDYKKPYYSFIIGGDIKKRKMNPDNLIKILSIISDFVSKNDGTLLISTSRRTNQDCIKILNNEHIKCKYYLYKWGKSSVLNPYYYFINSSDIVFTTADSISMMSEIVTIHKPIYAYLEDKLLTKKHIKFCNNLIKKGFIRKINEKTEINNIEKFDFKEMDELSFVAKEIKERL